MSGAKIRELTISHKIRKLSGQKIKLGRLSDSLVKMKQRYSGYIGGGIPGDLRSPTSDLRSPTSDDRPPASDFRPTSFYAEILWILCLLNCTI